MVSENVYQFDQFNPDYAELYSQPQFFWNPSISKTLNNNHIEHDGEGVTHSQL